MSYVYFLENPVSPIFNQKMVMEKPIYPDLRKAIESGGVRVKLYEDPNFTYCLNCGMITAVADPGYQPMATCECSYEDKIVGE